MTAWWKRSVGGTPFHGLAITLKEAFLIESLQEIHTSLHGVTSRQQPSYSPLWESQISQTSTREILGSHSGGADDRCYGDVTQCPSVWRLCDIVSFGVEITWHCVYRHGDHVTLCLSAWRLCDTVSFGMEIMWHCVFRHGDYVTLCLSAWRLCDTVSFGVEIFLYWRNLLNVWNRPLSATASH